MAGGAAASRGRRVGPARALGFLIGCRCPTSLPASTPPSPPPHPTPYAQEAERRAQAAEAEKQQRLQEARKRSAGPVRLSGLGSLRFMAWQVTSGACFE